MLHLSSFIVTALVTMVLPAVTAFVTKATASVGLKQFVTALLSAVTGLVVTATTLSGTALISKQAALLALTTFITTQATYWGFYKPHNANAKIAPTVGLG